MRKKETTCVLCGKTVSRRASLAVGPDRRACREHGQRTDVLVMKWEAEKATEAAAKGSVDHDGKVILLSRRRIK